MKQNEKLMDLNAMQLKVLAKNLKLGMDHLKHLLLKKQIQEVLQYENLTQTQNKRIKPGFTEHSKNLTLVVNTIFTGVIGTWLGLTGFIGLDLVPHKILLLILIILAAILSGYFGFYSAKQTQSQVNSAIEKQKLANLQLKVLMLAFNLQQKKINSTIAILNQYFREIVSLLNKISSNKIEDLPIVNKDMDMIDWINNLDNILLTKIKYFRDEDTCSFCIKELIKSENNLKKSLLKSKYNLHTGGVKQVEDEILLNMPVNIDVYQKTDPIDVLTESSRSLIKRNPHIAKKKIKIGEIVTGLLPAALGTFASLFIYFNGLPDIAKEYGIQSPGFVQHFYFKPTVIGLGMAITIYLAYTFIFSYKKSNRRQQELEKTNTLITRYETRIFKNEKKIHYLSKAKMNLKEVLKLLTILTAKSKETN